MHLKCVKRVDLMLSVLTTRKQHQRNREKLLKGMGVFITLIAMMISWMYACGQTDQIVYVKYAQFFAHQLYLKKAIFKKMNVK